MSSDKHLDSKAGPTRSPTRSQSPRKRTPYSRESQSDINDLRIQAIENRRIRNVATRQDSIDEQVISRFINELNEEEQEFKNLVDELSKKIVQSEEYLMSGDYFFKEHCNEIRRQVQLAKNLKIQRLEEMSEKLKMKIKEHEKKGSAALPKQNNDKLMETLNEMKLQNERWMKRLYKQEEINAQLIKQIKDCLSDYILEKENINRFLLNEQYLEFKEANDKDQLGEIIVVSMASFDENSVEKIEFSALLKNREDCTLTCSCNCQFCSHLEIYYETHNCDYEYDKYWNFFFHRQEIFTLFTRQKSCFCYSNGGP